MTIKTVAAFSITMLLLGGVGCSRSDHEKAAETIVLVGEVGTRAPQPWAKVVGAVLVFIGNGYKIILLWTDGSESEVVMSDDQLQAVQADRKLPVAYADGSSDMIPLDIQSETESR